MNGWGSARGVLDRVLARPRWLAAGAVLLLAAAGGLIVVLGSGGSRPVAARLPAGTGSAGPSASGTTTQGRTSGAPTPTGATLLPLTATSAGPARTSAGRQSGRATLYELGSVATTHKPVPACDVRVAAWTGRFGPLSVFVRADGPTTIRVQLNGTRHRLQVASIPAGQSGHEFDFKISPVLVTSVLVTASDSVGEDGTIRHGGSCLATGSLKS